MAMEKSVSHDLIFEILRYLPVKSLKRFESVSKSWFSLIHNPQFITRHLHHAAEFEILRRLPSKSLRRFQSATKSLYSLIHSPQFINRHLHQAAATNSDSTLISFNGTLGIVPSPKSLPDKLQTFRPSVGAPFQVLGSCNGLICVLISHLYVIIANLLIRDEQIVRIPSVHCVSCGEEGINHFPSRYGFGYDSVNDDYKVLNIMFCHHGRPRDYHAKVTIYSLRSNSWSEIKRWDGVGRSKVFPAFVSRNPVLASGALHWLARPYTSKEHPQPFSLFILAFDLTSEEFYEIALPEPVVGFVHSLRRNMELCLQLVVLKGCLCISKPTGADEPYHDIWIMERYNIQSSWITLFQVMDDSKFWNSLTPIICREDRVLLLEESKCRIYWYDLRNKMMCVEQKKEKKKREYGVFSVAAVHFDTLVSLSDYNTQREEGFSSKEGNMEYYIEKRIEALEAFSLLRDKFTLFRSKEFVDSALQWDYSDEDSDEDY